MRTQHGSKHRCAAAKCESARRKRGDIPGDGSGGTGALSDAAAAAPAMGRERAATARLIGEHIELIEADVMELARLTANSNAGG